MTVLIFRAGDEQQRHSRPSRACEFSKLRVRASAGVTLDSNHVRFNHA